MGINYIGMIWGSYSLIPTKNQLSKFAGAKNDQNHNKNSLRNIHNSSNSNNNGNYNSRRKNNNRSNRLAKVQKLLRAPSRATMRNAPSLAKLEKPWV